MKNPGQAPRWSASNAPYMTQAQSQTGGPPATWSRRGYRGGGNGFLSRFAPQDPPSSIQSPSFARGSAVAGTTWRHSMTMGTARFLTSWRLQPFASNRTRPASQVAITSLSLPLGLSASVKKEADRPETSPAINSALGLKGNSNDLSPGWGLRPGMDH